MDGGPSLALRVRGWWFNRGKRMYRTRGSYTGTPWQPYTSSERQYVAIKANIYRRAGARFSKRGDLLRWIRSGEKLYGALTNHRDPNAVYRANRKSINAGTKLGYADDLSRGGVAPAHLGGGTYPARPMLRFSGRAMTDLRRVIDRWARVQERAMQRRISRATRA